MNKAKAQILVVNAGGQYCHLIARRVREAGVQAKIVAPEEALGELSDVKGIVISGGPSSVYAGDAPFFPPQLFKGEVPILGLCYGHQVLAHELGGKVVPGKKHEYGEALIEIVQHDTILSGLDRIEPVWMSHADEVTEVPDGFQILARSDSCSVAAMANTSRRFFGIQFHPEVSDTPHGRVIIDNFLFNVCHCIQDWKIQGVIERLKAEIREQVGNRHVLFFVSGGVDSTVAFTLCSEALDPSSVTGVFVDTGFMRKGEKEEIAAAFTQRGWHNVRFEDKAHFFLKALEGEHDPERKRQIIGNCFLEVQKSLESELQLSSGGWMLGQGTIYPDTIESGFSKKAAVIKTHHNRVPAIQALIESGLVLEPLREFYKDEVRDLGRQLGLPEELVDKHPFPGPGLAVRCLCSSDEFLVEKNAELTDIVREFGLEAAYVPLRTVGVQGDHRSYSNLAILWGKHDLDVCSRVARKITREIRGANRVAFLVTSKSGADLFSARVHRRMIDKGRIDLLREADALVRHHLTTAGLSRDVWQFPVIALPLAFGGGETIALRPVSSSDAMTARHANLSMDFINRLGRELLQIEGVEMVLYDVTDKPPATIEWE